MKKLILIVLAAALTLTLCACGAKKDALTTAQESSYASSCLGPGEDGELYYDGFTVYTYRDPDGTENVYDVMPQQ